MTTPMPRKTPPPADRCCTRVQSTEKLRTPGQLLLPIAGVPDHAPRSNTTASHDRSSRRSKNVEASRLHLWFSNTLLSLKPPTQRKRIRKGKKKTSKFLHRPHRKEKKKFVEKPVLKHEKSPNFQGRRIKKKTQKKKPILFHPILDPK
jgi:hypothetical protein